MAKVDKLTVKISHQRSGFLVEQESSILVEKGDDVKKEFTEFRDMMIHQFVDEAGCSQIEENYRLGVRNQVNR